MSEEQPSVQEKPHTFPVLAVWNGGSRYAPIEKNVISPSPLGHHLSTRGFGLKSVLQNYAPILSNQEIDKNAIRFFEDIPDGEKNQQEKCIRDKFDPLKAAERNIFTDLSKFSVKNSFIMSQGAVKRSLVPYTDAEKTAVCNLIQFTKLSKTVKSDALIVQRLLDDACEAEQCILASTMPTNASYVSKMIDLFSQRAARNVFLSSDSKCYLNGCQSEEQPIELFKFNFVCSSHQSCIDNRVNKNNCTCDAVAFCRYCLCNYMAELYKISKCAVCPQCKKEFCPEDLILYNVAAQEIQPKKRSKK